jgi:lipoprotein-anchoring transpeptidase ErfK/SrfK
MRKLIAAVAIASAAMLAVPAADAASTRAKVTPAAFVAKPKAQAHAGKAKAKTCSTFIECLTGKKSTASVSGKKGKRTSVSDHATVEVVSWSKASKYQPGSIIVDTPNHSLYYVLDGSQARRYKVGVGRDGFRWSGNSKIVAKTEWPTWRPPAVMIKREAAKGHMLPDMMQGGPENPLGARAMYIGGTMFRIHGTNNPASIGGNVSSGCIRMMNTDVTDLYDLVKVGARVYVYQ